MKTRILSIVALLLVAATGAWAQTETLLTTITPTGKSSYSETKRLPVSITDRHTHRTVMTRNSARLILLLNITRSVPVSG